MSNETEELKALSFSEKIQRISELLEQQEIDEVTAYRLLIAEGEPKPHIVEETEQKPCIDFL